MGRIGVSVCDISCGLNALVGIQQALIQREHTGEGSGIKVSLFGSAAELMSVPYLQTRYGGKAPERVGLRHPSIAPYGDFTCADGRDLVISIQNEHEWAEFCKKVLLRPDLLIDPRCTDNATRVANREFVDGAVADVFARCSSREMIDRLMDSQTAFANVNSVYDLIEHPQLRTRAMPVEGRTIDVPASPWIAPWDRDAFPEAPALDADGESLRREFSDGA